MNKTMRSIIIALSLIATIISGGMLRSNRAFAQEVSEQSVSDNSSMVVWQANKEEAKQFIQIAEDLGAAVEYADKFNGDLSTSHTITSKTVSADELGSWLKVEQAVSEPEQAKARIIIIIIETDDWIIIIIIRN